MSTHAVTPESPLSRKAKRKARYTPRFNAEKKVVQKRDRSCRRCGARPADAHHIEYRSEGGADSRNNLILLCRPCHDVVHSDKGRYQPLCRGYIWAYYVLGQKLTLNEVARMVGMSRVPDRAPQADQNPPDGHARDRRGGGGNLRRPPVGTARRPSDRYGH